MLTQMLAGGQSGVSFFFVLSGFVLTWSAAGERLAAPPFWQRRAARIMPAYWVAWLVGIPVSWLYFGVRPSAVALAGTGTLTQSWFADKGVYFGVNGVGWSLSCEVVFYALFPALLSGLRRLGRRGLIRLAGGCLAVLIGLDLAALLVAGNAAGDPAGSVFWWVSILPISRLPEFLLGMVAAQALSLTLVPEVRMLWAAGIVVAAVFGAGLFPAAAVAGGLTALPFALLILAAAQADMSGRSRMLVRGWLVRLGTWSFAFYLTHQLVLRLAERVWPATSLLWLHLVLVAGAAIAVSAGLYRFVEEPAERRWRSRSAAAPAERAPVGNDEASPGCSPR